MNCEPEKKPFTTTTIIIYIITIIIKPPPVLPPVITCKEGFYKDTKLWNDNGDIIFCKQCMNHC